MNKSALQQLNPKQMNNNNNLTSLYNQIIIIIDIRYLCFKNYCTFCTEAASSMRSHAEIIDCISNLMRRQIDVLKKLQLKSSRLLLTRMEPICVTLTLDIQYTYYGFI